jgi:superfamily II DNA or RNA helicase
MLRALNLKAVYRSDEDNILEDFYLPALSVSNSYDRAVGYFSAAMISYAAQGLSSFINNNGKMRLVIGGELDAGDEQAIREGYDTREISDRLGLKILDTIERVDDSFFFRRLEALSWLVACGRLDIKIALRKKGMYHEKIGIIRDADGDAVVFQGSANETANALLPDFNFESINVFPCWKEDLSPHFTPYVNGFTKLWENKAKNTCVIEFPEAARQKLIKIAEKCRPPSPEIELEYYQESLLPIELPEDSSLEPTIPKIFNGNEFRLEEHQLKALNLWKAHGYQGILAHATGSGKTITAIFGAIKVFEATKALVLGIAVPYQNLADQWVATLKHFNISAIRCYGSREEWHSRLSQLAYLYQSGAVKFICFVVVNRTLQTQEFQNILGQFPGGNLMWIGDECHHHSSVNLSAALPRHAKMRLGLSATPEHYIDTEATQRLKDFYGDVVSEFTLAQALEAKVITPYKYFVCAVDLSEDEATAYREISEKISRLAVRSKTDDVESSGDDQMKALLAQRARLLGCASGKITALEALLGNASPQPFTLFYCGDGSTDDEESGEYLRHVEQISRFLYRHGWKCSHFTSRELRDERQKLLNSFRFGIIDALVAIRCLDEGIDVPACKTAYLLASSRNPKQFIQRRGRILRKSEGKEFATIYDFLVKFPEDSFAADENERRLVQAELKRVAEFSKLAMNSTDAVRTLMPVLKHYDLAHLLV